MRVDRGTIVILCAAVALADAHLARAQDATSANLPEQFENPEAMPAPRPKKKKGNRV